MLNFKYIFLFLLLLVSAQELLSQFSGFNKIPDATGRFNNAFEVVMNPFAEDSIGNIWIASKQGLCKYSGSKTTCIEHERNNPNSLSSNDIEGMLMDSDNRIWVACNQKGVDVFDLQGDRILHLEHTTNDSSTILTDRVWGMFEDDLGYVWLSYFEGGISAYHKKSGKIEHFDLDNIVSDTTFRARTVGYTSKHDTEEHVFWLSTLNGLVKWNTKTRTGGSFLFYSEYDPEKLRSEHNGELLSSNHQRVMYKDSDGILWMGSFGGLVRFDPKTETHKVFFKGYNNQIRNTIGIEEFDEDHIMIATLSGLLLFNRKTFKLDKISNKYPNSGQSFLFGRMYKAKNGCTYLAASGRNRGVYQWCDHFNLFKKTHIKNNCNEVIATEDFVHYNNIDGMVSRNLKTNKIISHPFPNEEFGRNRAVFPLGGDSLLFGNILNGYYYHPNFGIKNIPKLRKVGLFRFESILKDSEGLIWTGRQRQGIFTYNPKNGDQNYLTKENNSLPDNNYIDDLFEDSDHDIWISTAKGWSIYNRKEHLFNIYTSDIIEKRFGLDISKIKTIRETPDGKIWIVDNQEGIVIWDKERDTVEQFIAFDRDFMFDGVWDAELDQEGNIWLVNSSGEIARIDYETKDIKVFDKSYGINSSLYSINNSPSGKMYIGSSSGYYEFSPQDVTNYEPSIIKPAIEGFSIFDQKQDSLLFKEQIELKHDENFFSFDVSSLNYLSPNRELYQVRLSPFDQIWQPIGEMKYKGYTNIPPGKYAFQVRVSDDNIHWEYSNPVQIKLKAIWYETWTFRIISLGLIAFGIWAYFDNRRKAAIEKAETERKLSELNMKALRAQMNPHFLFNSLNSIRYHIVSNDRQTAADYLTKFSRLVRIILQNSEEELVSLEEELYLMQLYIEMEQIRFVDKFDFKLEIDPSIDKSSLQIPPMIIQPFLENSIIHGINPLDSRGLLELKIYKEDQRIHVIIQDNGIGRKASQKSKTTTLKKKSMGMNITQNRIDILLDSSAMDKKILEDLYDKNGQAIGTKVHFSLPEVLK